MLALTALTLLSFWLWTPDLPRTTLEARYLAAPTDLRQVGPWQLHVRDSGPPRPASVTAPSAQSDARSDAPAVVLLHGFGASLQTWDVWAEGLAATHRVVRIDLPGSGLSPPDPAHDYRDERSLQLLRALLDDLGLPRASLVGHSMGGRIAWTFAAQFPERIDKLVLVAPDGYASFGFEYGKASPIDELTGDRIGGDKMWYGNFEYIFPLFKEAGLNGVVFFDIGKNMAEDVDWSLEDYDMASGLELRWLSPMGPLRLVWGVNLDPENDEDRSVWDFSIGGGF